MSAQSKHTPKPWRVEFIGDNACEISPMGYLLRFGGSSDSYSDEATANAVLIGAAPDLLEAAKNILACLQDAGEDQKESGEDFDDIKQLKAAIQKATYEPQS